MNLFLDFETRSILDLNLVGLDRYLSEPSTIPLMCAYAFDDSPVKLWWAWIDPMPGELRAGLLDSNLQKIAWNVEFEVNLLQRKLAIDVPLEQWEDAMVRARFLSLPGGLGEAGEILGVHPDKQKLEEGSKLIKLFCMPKDKGGQETLFGIAPPFFCDWNTNPVEWEKFCEYCKRDVEAERALFKKMADYKLPAIEQKAWILDQRINQRGLPVDEEFVRGAKQVAEKEKSILLEKLKKITKLENPNSGDQFLPWARERNYSFNSLGKPFVARALAGESDLTSECREALLLRKQASKTSDSKLTAICDTVGEDSRLRYQFTFMGAARSGRWAAHGAQPQNFSRPTKELESEEKMDRAIELLTRADHAGVTREYSNVMDVISSTIRGAFRAPKGYRMVVCDLSAIENRVLGWLSGCDAILNVFRRGRDPYLDFATRLYNKPYDELWRRYCAKDPEVKEMRQVAKPAVLGCFGADTLVLTNRGWLPITKVELSDKVFDGHSFVNHEGVVYQGKKSVINMAGIVVTPDHKIFTREKDTEEAWLVNTNTYLKQKAVTLARERLSSTDIKEEGYSIFANANAARSRGFPHITWKEASKRLARIARTCREFILNLKDWLPNLLYRDFPTATLLCEGGVEQNPAMYEKASKTSSFLWKVSSNIASLYRGTMILVSKLTGLITMQATRRETYASLREQGTMSTEKITSLSNGMEKCSLPSTFGRNTAEAISISAASIASCDGGFRRKKLLQRNTTECVYDIANAGKMHRFMILTNDGPMLVHNCGYGLSGGEEKLTKDGDRIKTALWGYASSLSVDLTREQAHNSVSVFRKSYPEVVSFWYNLEDAAKAAIECEGQIFKVGYISFQKVRKVLKLILPSGRPLHYINPRITLETYVDKYGREKEREKILYDGIEHKQGQTTFVWGPTSTYGAKFCENSCQAVARDVLLNGMFRAEEIGFEIVGSAHDELITLAKIESDLHIENLIKAMTDNPSWSRGLPLEAAGYETTGYYRK